MHTARVAILDALERKGQMQKRLLIGFAGPALVAALMALTPLGEAAWSSGTGAYHAVAGPAAGAGHGG
ncbi:MAG: hypothetical protein M3R26_01415 [Actinomycetota bacterium]|nr:hypothetical protein [Actinomycetota bacterium]